MPLDRCCDIFTGLMPFLSPDQEVRKEILHFLRDIVVVNRLGRISDSLARRIREDIRSEIEAVKEAGDREREMQELRLLRQLNDDKRDRIVDLVNIAT